jgi:peroxiredoxin
VLRAGLPKRETFLIGPDGRVLHRFDSVKPAGHGTEVLNKLLETNPPLRPPRQA